MKSLKKFKKRSSAVCVYHASNRSTLYHTVADLIPAVKPRCTTCLDLGRGRSVRRILYGDDGARVEGHMLVSAFVESSGRGCPYCGLSVQSIAVQADYLIQEDATIDVYFPPGGVRIIERNLAKDQTKTLIIYAPIGL